MTKQRVGRLAWLARVGVPTWTIRDSPVSGRLTALVSCVLPATADQAPATPAGGPEAPTQDCEPSAPDPLGTPRMTAC